MKKREKQAALLLALASGAAMAAALPLAALPAFGRWLRALSLSGGTGNLAAWGITLVLTALPALGLLWRGRCGWDWLLVLAAGEIFAGVFFLVNPAMLRPGVDSEAVGTMWALAATGSTAATLLAWAVLRGLGRLERTTGRTMEGLFLGAALLLGWLAAWSQCADLIAELRAAAESNTAPGLILWPTYLVLCLLAAAKLIPELLGCAVLVWGGRLARAMESAPFGEETVAAAERLSRRCGLVASSSVLLCAGGNLLQMLFFSQLHATHFQVAFPFSTMLLAAALGLLCRYFRRAKAVSDDNDTII
ncbi:MAG: hypothetical protein HFF82_09975 [Oscillospiraceae bacterium]|jgi:hypothetical protein|nr:hypothetical protein [Oscillospiraceae bacterium]